MYVFERMNDGNVTISEKSENFKLTVPFSVRESELDNGLATLDDLDNISADWKLFKKSNRSFIGNPVDIQEMNAVDLKDIYNQLLEGCILLAEDFNHGKASMYTKAVEWLQNTDFYVAPGSSYFHDSEVTGLLKHTLRVYNCICEVWRIPKFNHVRIHEAALVALVHDWCKIGLYESYKRNVKNEQTKQWESVDAFKRGVPKFPLGHGDTSLYLASKFFRLTLEQSVAIKWHMGHWYTHGAEENDLQASNELYPMVHLVQFADQLSIVKY